MKIGDRVHLSGGYDYKPEWLGESSFYFGRVVSFIPGQNDTPAAVIKLDNEITVKSYTGDIVVLELRYKGDKWAEKGTVHIELCNFIPEEKPWQQRKQGEWVESNATYNVIHK